MSETAHTPLVIACHNGCDWTRLETLDGSFYAITWNDRLGPCRPAHQARARMIRAAVNSYGKLRDPIAAAESDLLGRCLAVVSAVVANEEAYGELEEATITDARRLLAEAGVA